MYSCSTCILHVDLSHSTAVQRFLDIRNVPRVRRASPDPAAFEVTEREDLRSRSPSPELPAPEFPDTDPLASSTDTEPMTPDQS